MYCPEPVTLSPSLVILSEAKNPSISLRINSAKDHGIFFSTKDWAGGAATQLQVSDAPPRPRVT